MEIKLTEEQQKLFKEACVVAAKRDSSVTKIELKDFMI